MTRSFRQRLQGWLAPLAIGGLATVATFANGADTPKPGAKANSAAELDQKILDEVRNSSEIMKNLTHISDVIGHRLTGSKSLEQANNYTADVMKKYGLENVRLEPWEIPIGWQRGFVKMKLTEPREMELLACSAGWQPGTKGKVTGPVVVLERPHAGGTGQVQGQAEERDHHPIAAGNDGKRCVYVAESVSADLTRQQQRTRMRHRPRGGPFRNLPQVSPRLAAGRSGRRRWVWRRCIPERHRVPA